MDKPAKKTLHLKIGLAVIFAVLSPYILGLFFPLTSIFFILAGIISAALSIIFIFWTLKPLGQLIKNAGEFAGGNLNIRTDIRSGDEFEDVGTAFNLMLDKISKTLQQLETDRDVAVSEKNKLNEILASLADGVIAVDFNKNILLFNKSAQELTGFTETEVLGKPIDQLIHFFAMQDEILSKTYCKENFSQTAKLIGKSDKQTKINLTSSQVNGTIQSSLSCILVLHDLSREEELEQMKLDFVSMASHELKTPLTSIVGYLSVALNESKDKMPIESLQLMQKAFTSAQQLQTLIQNLLNVNKIEKDKFTVSSEPIDYLPILSKAVEDLRNQANQKNIVLTLKSADNLPKVLTDQIRTYEVITNLVANAINYTNPGGKVEITTNITPSEIATTISDTGVGMPKEAIPHLFGKFFRVSNLEQKGNKGTGLGLYISKSIIEKLHGKIWVESEEGRGSKFSFTLPLATQTAGFLDRNKFTSQAIQSGSLNY